MSALASIGVSALAQFVQGLASNNSPPTASTANPNAPKKVGGPHHRHGQGGGLKQIQNAVLNALQTAKSSGATTDPDQAIEEALAKVFKSSIAAPTGDTAGTTDATGTSEAATPQSFQSILQSFGVTPQQFQTDLTKALQEAQGGQVNLGTALQSFSPGSLLDVVG
jgi:hypothetical protein